MRVAIPRLDKYPIVWLRTEVLLNIVNNDRLCKIAPEFRQVLQVSSVQLVSAVAVQPVCDPVLCVHRVDDEISVVLESGCEDAQLVVTRHLAEEFERERTHLEVPLFGIEVHQSLVEIEHEGVLVRMLDLGQNMLLRKRAGALTYVLWSGVSLTVGRLAFRLLFLDSNFFLPSSQVVK